MLGPTPEILQRKRTHKKSNLRHNLFLTVAIFVATTQSHRTPPSYQRQLKTSMLHTLWCLVAFSGRWPERSAKPYSSVPFRSPPPIYSTTRSEEHTSELQS